MFLSAFPNSEQCENFRYTKDVFAPNSIQIISNVSASSLDYVYAICTAECFANWACNAVDVCGTFCRLIRGWDSLYSEENSTDVCQRYQIECSQGEYYDRLSKACVAHEFCDFESDPGTVCFLGEDSSDDGNWIRNSGTTNTASTGPSTAKFGSFYKYMDAATLKRNDEVTLVSTRTFMAKSYCLTFYYHMFGTQTGTLTVLTQNGTSSAETKWTVSGENQDVWREVPGIDLNLDSQTKILITATRDNGDYGDIAVDFVQLWPYPC
ncbi:thyroid hormone-induced protein B-like [Saccostrea echinata]|uniref:thyroid hormone-induced protein B-like n=1 Tax=Saccostrea echinata TaxID=191078 RepID=UPI002A8206B7|nr:thyroid hormone-induced protein B-like [Saccostrea echinata]